MKNKILKEINVNEIMESLKNDSKKNSYLKVLWNGKNIEVDLNFEDFEKEIFEDNFTVIVIYDIISNKRRIQLSKLLSAFGFRIQRSAFECLLTREKYKLLVERINRYAKAEDLIRVYRLNQNVVTEIYGENSEAENENKAYYFF